MPSTLSIAFVATCPPTIAPLTWVGQLGLLVALILLPRLARVGTIATIAVLGTVFPASVLLFATGDPDSMAVGRSILGGLMILAGILAFAFPFLFSVAIVVFLGWLLIISGVVQAISLIGASKVPHFWLQLVSVALS